MSFFKYEGVGIFVELKFETMEVGKDVKLLYIQEELSQHGEWLSDLLTEAIEARQLKATGDLQNSINYRAFTNQGNPGLQFSFFGYGRAVDINGYKQNRHEVDTNEVVWGMKKNRPKKRNQWYARNMYGGLNRLVSRIMYGLTDEEIERLKGILQERMATAVRN